MKKDNVETATKKPTRVNEHSYNPPTPSANSSRPSTSSPTPPKVSDTSNPNQTNSNITQGRLIDNKK